jgi:hypothetical protein
LPLGAKGVASQVKLQADLTPPIHSDPPNEILSYFLVDPSEDFHFLDPIQVSNFIFDLCGIHAYLTFQIQAITIARRHRFYLYASQVLAVAFCGGHGPDSSSEPKRPDTGVPAYTGSSEKPLIRMWCLPTECRYRSTAKDQGKCQAGVQEDPHPALEIIMINTIFVIS